MNLLIYAFRCTTPADHLDDDIYGRRSSEHTEMLVQEFELGVLWDEYGLVRDIVVSVISSCFFSLYPISPDRYLTDYADL
jgi:hypothetical protein